MTEFYARKDYIYDGDSRIFTIPFPCIDTRYIKVYVNGVSSSWLKLNESQIEVADWVELNTGDLISIRRETSIDNPLVVFNDKSILNEESQNLAQSQMFYSVQELYDNTNQFKEDITQTVSEGIESISEGLTNTRNELQTQITQGDNELQTQFNTFKNTVNLTSERLSLIEDCTLTCVSKSELAEQSAQSAQNYAEQAQTSANTVTNKVLEINTASEKALSDIEEQKNLAIEEIEQAAAPSDEILKNYYTKIQVNNLFENYYTKSLIDTKLGDIESLLDSINGEVI